MFANSRIRVFIWTSTGSAYVIVFDVDFYDVVAITTFAFKFKFISSIFSNYWIYII
jgi:hypothetical protein